MIDRGIHTSYLKKNVTYIFRRIKKKVAHALKKNRHAYTYKINDGAYSGQFFPPSLKGNNTSPALKKLLILKVTFL